ncbi:MAG: zinc ribbon domain-containing protein [Kiritimatiellae bacterium]|nr:zinc ribbon domain-containing protein [Kiritimatiellia bacterium]
MFYGPTRTASLDTGARIAADHAKAKADSVRSELDELRFEIERLLMITEALWGVLKEQHGYDDKELIRRVVEIDARDGAIDGRVAPTAPGRCPHCERPLAKKRQFCLYCGKPVPRDIFER